VPFTTCRAPSFFTYCPFDVFILRSKSVCGCVRPVGVTLVMVSTILMIQGYLASPPMFRPTLSPSLDLMTALPIGANQHWCNKCICYFSSQYNLTHHQTQTANACHFNDNTISITPRKIINPLTGKL
jgi:hypothetical protein